MNEKIGNYALVALFAIVVLLLAISWRLGDINKSIRQSVSPTTSMNVKYSVVEVVKRISTDYGLMGIGQTAFLVKDGDHLTLAQFDSGSRLDRMPQPVLLLKIDNGTTVSYQPLFDVDSVNVKK